MVFLERFLVETEPKQLNLRLQNQNNELKDAKMLFKSWELGRDWLFSRVVMWSIIIKKHIKRNINIDFFFFFGGKANLWSHSSHFYCFCLELVNHGCQGLQHVTSITVDFTHSRVIKQVNTHSNVTLVTFTQLWHNSSNVTWKRRRRRRGRGGLALSDCLIHCTLGSWITGNWHLTGGVHTHTKS